MENYEPERTWRTESFSCFTLNNRQRDQAERLSRNPDDETVELDQQYQDVVTVFGRDFQRYSVFNRIYFGPVDDVRESTCWNFQNDIYRSE